MAAVEIITGDITSMKVDAIVCPAHKHLIRGQGLSAQIYDKAGSQLVKECDAQGKCGVGEAVITKAYNMPAKYIIHTVTPQWSGGDQWGVKSLEQLRQCYKSVVEVAMENSVRSLVFPALGEGTNRFPHSAASHQGLDVINENLDDFDRLVVCLHSDADRNEWLETQKKFFAGSKLAS